MNKHIKIFLFLNLTTLLTYSQCLEEVTELIPTKELDRSSNYGQSISLYGEYLAVAETNNDSLASNSGVIFVYKIQVDESWKKIATLKASDPSENFYLGHFLDFGKNVIIAGSGISPSNTIYVFTKEDSEEWQNSTETYSFQIREISESKPLNTRAISASESFLAISYSYSFTSSDDYEVNTNIYQIGNIDPVVSIPSKTDSAGFLSPSLSIEFGLDYVALAYPGFRRDEFGNELGVVQIYNYDETDGWSVEPTAGLLPSIEKQISFGVDMEIYNDTIFVANAYDRSNNLFESRIFGFAKPESGWTDSNESFILQTGKTNSGSNDGAISVNENYLIYSKWFENDISVFQKSNNWTDQISNLTFELPESDSHENPILGERHLLFNARSNPHVINYYRASGDFENIAADYDSLDNPTFSAANFQFGESVSIDDNHMAVGAPTDGSGGAAYYYVKDDGEWQFHSKISSPSENDFFGNAVELKDSLLFVSALFADSLNADGSFFLPSAGKVFQYEMKNGTWEYKASLASPDLDEGNVSNKAHFGQSISYSDGYVAVGRYYSASSETDGRVFVYEAVSDDWSHVATMQPEEDSRGDRFGMKILLHDSLLVVGAFGYEEQSGNTVFIFNREGDEWNDTFEDASLVPVDRYSGSDEFGKSFWLYDSLIVVGATNGNATDESRFGRAGRAYIFRAPENGWYGEINEQVILEPRERIEGSQFGISVFINETDLLVGGLQNESGAIFRFDRSLRTSEENNIINESEIILPTSSKANEFGFLIAGNDTDIFISDPTGDTEESLKSGRVLQFRSKTTKGIAEIEACEEYVWLGMTFTKSGTYFATLQNAAGCDSLVSIDLVISEPVDVIIETEENVLSWEIDGTNESYIYQWYDCSTNQPIEGANSPEYLIDQSGSYQLSVDDGVCISFSSCIEAELVLSVDEIHPITIYPNPTMGQLYLSRNINSQNITITDLAGCVQNIKMENNTLDLSNLAVGIYILTIENHKVSQSFKISKR